MVIMLHSLRTWVKHWDWEGKLELLKLADPLRFHIVCRPLESATVVPIDADQQFLDSIGPGVIFSCGLPSLGIPLFLL
jgi:hypothetical protein